MEVINVIWIVAFSVLQLAIVTVNYVIRCYLANKPMGMQTLIDSVIRDLSIGKKSLRQELPSTDKRNLKYFHFRVSKAKIYENSVNLCFLDLSIKDSI
jgi:hypothetical protein